MRPFQPDISQLHCVLRREVPDRPVLFEFLIDEGILRRHTDRHQAAESGTLEYFTMTADAFRNLGYDYAPLYPWLTDLLTFPRAAYAAKASHSQNEGAVITDESGLEAYAWPDPQSGRYELFEQMKNHLPEGMKLLACSNGGILENATDLCGFDNLCMMYMLDPELTERVFEEIGSRLHAYYEIVSAFDTVGVCVVNDDWGFKTQTMFPPEMMRTYVFPWTKKIIRTIHDNGKPVILHSCGNLKDIMDEVIDDLEIDAKHSFEDNIYPVETAYDLWHDRMALVGGIDVNFLCTRTPEEICKRARTLLGRTAESGGYALGSGNSITSYMPEENYLAMIRGVNDF